MRPDQRDTIGELKAGRATLFFRRIFMRLLYALLWWVGAK
jgi:hypothetical protein